MRDQGKLDLRIDSAGYLDRRRATIHKHNFPIMNELSGFFRYDQFLGLTVELPLQYRVQGRRRR
jgi:hypothetical protein